MDGWWTEMENEILASLRRRGAVEPGEIGRELGIGERATVSLLAMLAAEGKVRICLVAAPPRDGEASPPTAPPA
jgi:predicted ArsR family transcriptional regulator